MNFIQRIWTGLRSSLWFVPTLVVLGSVAAALMLIEIQGLPGENLAQRWPRVFGASAGSSREILAAIATSMMTVAGVVFSVTIVALSLASTQYSPRVLRNFMRDRPTQWVLGVFVGIFAYCLVVLRTIRGADGGAGGETFIPSIAVLAGIAYAFAGIAFLIFFIHHVAQSIQASSIVARILADTAATIDRLYPQDIGASAPESPRGDIPMPSRWTPVCSGASSYVVAVDSSGVLKYATQSGRVLRLGFEIGDFVVEGAALMELSGEGAVPDEDARELRRLVSLEPQRTVEQDAAFGLQQLVDVAVKALSPGINDPTTACMCIDQLGALLARLASRHIPDPRRVEDGHLRVIAPTPGFAQYLRLVFVPVVHHARSDPQVLGRLLSVLEMLQDAAREPTRRRELAGVARDLRRELGRVRPAARAATLRGRARALEKRLHGSQ